MKLGKKEYLFVSEPVIVVYYNILKEFHTARLCSNADKKLKALRCSHRKDVVIGNQAVDVEEFVKKPLSTVGAHLTRTILSKILIIRVQQLSSFSSSEPMTSTSSTLTRSESPYE